MTETKPTPNVLDMQTEIENLKSDVSYLEERCTDLWFAFNAITSDSQKAAVSRLFEQRQIAAMEVEEIEEEEIAGPLNPDNNPPDTQAPADA